MTVRDLLSVINERILDLGLNSTFTAQELLHDYWEQIPENMRTTFGIEFSKAVEDGIIQNAEFVQIQRSGRQNEYRRTQ